MGKNPKVILKILVISIIGIWVLSKVSFESNIDQTIIAKVYEDGAFVQNTSVIINGSRSNYLFAKSQNYDGRFILEYYERTGRENMKASITWNKEYIEQRILYYQNATFPTLEINFELLINKEMDEFALGMQDGIIIATSDEMYRDYTENVYQSIWHNIHKSKKK